MNAMLITLSFLAASKEIEELKGTWTSDAGTVIVIEDEQVWIGKGEQAEFKGLVALPKKGVLQIVVNGEVAIEMAYSIKDDKLTVTIDGSDIEYKRMPVRRGG